MKIAKSILKVLSWFIAGFVALAVVVYVFALVALDEAWTLEGEITGSWI